MSDTMRLARVAMEAMMAAKSIRAGGMPRLENVSRIVHIEMKDPVTQRWKRRQMASPVTPNIEHSAGAPISCARAARSPSPQAGNKRREFTTRIGFCLYPSVLQMVSGVSPQ